MHFGGPQAAVLDLPRRCSLIPVWLDKSARLSAAAEIAQRPGHGEFGGARFDGAGL